MEDTSTLVQRTRAGDTGAYGELVRRLQDMAVGYAQSLLGDFQLAEDAAQEAFVHAFLDLDQLREPAAFAAWLRRIVLTRCRRVTRRRQPETALLNADTVEARDVPPDQELERRQSADRVTDGLQRLRDTERQVLTLFYISELSHKELSAFLGVPVSTVKFRLHSARKRLKEELLAMTRHSIRRQRPSRTDAFTRQIVKTVTALNAYQMGQLLVSTEAAELVALMHSSGELRAKVLEHVDAPVQAYLEDALRRHPPSPPAVRRAQERVARVANRLPAAPLPTTQEFDTMKKQLVKKLNAHTFPEMGPAAIPEVFLGLAECARTEGILSLSAFKSARDPFFAGGLDMVLHGTEPDVIAEVLAPWVETRVHDLAARCALCATAVREIAGQRHPQLVAIELATHYSAGGQPPAVDEKAGTITRFRSQVRGRSFADMPLAELAEALMTLVLIAHKHSAARLSKVLDAIDQPYARQVFEWLVEGVKGAHFDSAPILLPMLDHARQAAIRRHKLCDTMAADGLYCLQMGMNPALLQARQLSFLD